MEQTDFRKELLTLLSQRGLARDELLSVSLALAKQEHAAAMIDLLKINENLSVDEIFQKAGEIVYGKNS